LTAYSEPEIVIQAAESGAMGYLVKPVDTTQLIPAIETAISRKLELEGLRGTTQNLQSALDADRSVSVAVGIIMDQRGIGQKDALAQLRKAARSKQINLIDLANKVVNSREILNLEIGA
jgi:response regulator NasT